MTGLLLVGSAVISVSIDATIRQWSLRPTDLKTAKEAFENKKGTDEQQKKESFLTEEEERELAELMEDE